jgi:hypothetical protein
VETDNTDIVFKVYVHRIVPTGQDAASTSSG